MWNLLYRSRLSLAAGAVIRGRITVYGGRPRGHRGISIGADTHIYPGCRLVTDAWTPRSGIEVGSRCAFNYDCYLGGSGGITIGDDVLLGPKVAILSGGHEFRGAGLIREQGPTLAEVVVADNVWIGAHAVILPGVHIGSGAVVAAGAVVTHDVPERHVAMGVPATSRPIDRPRELVYSQRPG